MSRGVKIGLVVVVVAAVAAVGVWYVALRDTAPPPADLAALDAAAQSRGTDGGAGAGGVEPAGADGTWLVADDDAVFAGYRIEEIFAGETIKKTAVGRTSDVTGTLTVDGRRIESVDVEVDTTTLRSDSERRDQFIGNRGLQTDVFPQATFTLTEPLDLPGAPEEGEEMTVTAEGDLTLHGQTRPVSVELTARWNGSTISVQGSVPITLADFGIEQISLPIVTVDEAGTLEFLLLFEREA